MTNVMTWRQFMDQPDGKVRIRTFTTAIGQTPDEAHSVLQSEAIVTKAEAVDLLRHGAP